MTRSAAYCAPLSGCPAAMNAVKLRPWVYHCLFGLLSVSGLRLGEARNLELQDVDLEGGGVDDPRRQVRQDSPRAFACLNLQGARRLHRPPSTPLGRTAGLLLFVRLQLGQSFGWRRHSSNLLCAVPADRSARPTDSHGPRLHDMRHRFATNTLVRWYRSGQDPERRLPLLSAYLGHVHVADTQWYLEASPELMREAMRRLHSAGRIGHDHPRQLCCRCWRASLLSA